MNDEDDGNNGSSRSSNNYLTSIWNNHYVKAVVTSHVFFGVFLNPGDKLFTPTERFFNFCGFVGVNTAVTSLIETVDLEEKVVCDCIDGDKPDSNCKDTDTIQDDWLVYFHGDTWPEELCWYDAAATAENKHACSAKRICCEAFVASELDKTLSLTDYDNCNEDLATKNIISSVVSTAFSFFFFGPLVEWMLRRESQCCNPAAYFMILLQMIWGLTFTLHFSHTSAQLGEGKKAWMDIISTVGLGVFVWSVAFELMKQMLYVVCCDYFSDLEEEDDGDSEAGPDGKKAMDEEQNLSSPQVDKPSSKIDQQMNQDPTEDPTEDRTEPLSPSSSLNHPGGEVMHC
ncbi:unknown protein [Seminavis robusta]|uniref:Uncharacterized protein n=1 Tax=Seminavis robusta TaxID=568900 RepID=A0A9N8HHZ3_9STRA|nr:unknown protein [Seminavis robusta]|eukprot:Sro563_g167210.1 n/a (343) ;mRNA; r:35979-37007